MAVCHPHDVLIILAVGHMLLHEGSMLSIEGISSGNEKSSTMHKQSLPKTDQCSEPST